MKSRKAEGLSLSVVVIAAIALIVLIVLVLIFSGRLNLFNLGVTGCPPGSQDKTASEVTANNGLCPDDSLPVKVIGKGTDMRYCCSLCGGKMCNPGERCNNGLCQK
jgi:hypothetical protein